MYLYARTRTSAPDRLPEATAYAIEMAAKVSSITGLEVAARQAVYGAPLTSFTWTTRVESHAEMGQAWEKLGADTGFLEGMQAGAALFESPAEDMLYDIVAMTGEGGHRGDYASLVSAQCTPGKIAEAVGWGVEILNHVGSVTGRDGMFCRAVYGPWATVGWVSLASSLAEVDAATTATNADAAYLAKVDGAGNLFAPGSASSRLTRRIG